MTMMVGTSPAIPDGGGTVYYVDDWVSDDGWYLTVAEDFLPNTRGGIYKRDFVTISGGVDYLVRLNATANESSTIVVIGEKADNTYEIIGTSVLPKGNNLVDFWINPTENYTGLGFIWDSVIPVEIISMYVGDGEWISNLDKLRNATEVKVKILDDVTQKLQGIIVGKPSHKYDGIFENVQISLEATDSIKKLDVDPGDFVIRNAKIMDTTNISGSIVHQMAYNAGLTGDNIGDFNINVTLSGFATISGNGSVLSELDTLLYENGYVLHMNEFDKIYPIAWIVPSGTASSHTFDEDNIMLELDVQENEKEYEGVEVTYYNVGEKHDVLLFRDDLPYSSDGEFEGYLVLPDYYYPTEANVIDEDTGLNEAVYFDYDDTGIKALTNKAIANGLDYDPRTAMSAFKSDFSDIICTSGHFLMERDDGLTLVSSGFWNNRAQVLYKNNTASGINIYYLNVYGSVLYKSAERKTTVTTVSGTRKVEEYKSKYVYDKTIADNLAKAKANVHSVGGIYYSFTGEDDIDVGAYCNIVANNRTNQYALVLEKTYNNKTEQFSYKLKSYSENLGTVVGRSTVRNTVYPTVDTISVGLDKYSMTILSDINGENLILNEPNITANVLLNGADFTDIWGYSVSTSGVLGTLADNIYTISGMDAEKGFVDFTFNRTNYTDKVLRCEVVKSRQGVTDYVYETIPQIAPIYKGRVTYSGLSGVVGNENDTIMAYDTTSGYCGIYKRVGGSWGNKVWPPTSEMTSASWTDVVWAVNQVPSYPASGTAQEKIQAYTGEGLTYFEMLGANLAFINSLFVQNLVLASGGSAQSSNFALGADGFPSAGYRLTNNTGLVEAVGARLSVAEIRGVQWSGAILVGSGLSLGINYSLASISAFDENKIAVVGNYQWSDKILQSYRFDVGTWSTTGSGLAIGGYDDGIYNSISALSNSSVACLRYGAEDSLSTYATDGTNWAIQGDKLTISGSVCFTTIGPNRVAVYRNADNGDLFDPIYTPTIDVYTCFSGVWALESANAFRAEQYLNYPAITAFDENLVAFVAGDDKEIMVLSYDTDTKIFTQRGETYVFNLTPVGGVNLYNLCVLNKTDIIIAPGGVSLAKVFRFSGSTFTEIISSGDLALGASNKAMTPLNGTDFAFLDSTYYILKLYRFNFSLSTPYRTWRG